MNADKRTLDEVLGWCGQVLGPFDIMADHSRDHPDREVGALKLWTDDGEFYLKRHESASGWAREVHAYEAWASAFGDKAPRLIAVRDEAPLALVISLLPGVPLESATLEARQEARVWRAAGEALRVFHDSASGTFFGPCKRSGDCAQTEIHTATDHVARQLQSQLRRGVEAEVLSRDERRLIQHAQSLVAAFDEQPSVPAHRDYCPANWLVTDDGRLSGVIDFEFSGWDVEEADLTRDPEWTWMSRPELVEGFLAGYGHQTSEEARARLFVARLDYALSAIVWGSDNAYHGFVREGRDALERLSATQLQWPPLQPGKQP